MPIDALAAIILCVCIAAIVYGPWQTYCTDAGRQSLFEIRDELFDMARSGQLSFESKQYRVIRTAIEQNIRYAHMLTIWRFLIIYFYMAKNKTSGQKSEFSAAVDEISDSEVRLKVQQLHVRCTQASIYMMLAKAPVFILILALFVLAKRMTDAVDGAKTRLSSIYDGVAALSARAGEAIQKEAESVCA